MLPRLFKRRELQLAPMFAPGTLKLSEKVHWLAKRGLIDPLSYVQRHVRGDWGVIDEATRQTNDAALSQDHVIFSRYRITPHLDVIVMTNDDQSITAVQLPEEKNLI